MARFAALAWLAPRRGERAVIGFLCVYAAVLLYFRPATPFEWDEVLYQRALDRYDVATHSPHPPGAPLFIAVAKTVRVVVRDPQLAVQGTVVLAALAGLYWLFRLALRLGAPHRAALASVVILAAVPGFCFHANVGLSDVPSTVGMVGAALACVVAWGDLRRLPLAAVVTALALGVRPQVLPVLLPFGLVLIVAAVRQREWKRLGNALVAGVATSAAVWLPAMLVTGFSRYWGAVRGHAHYLATVERRTHLPYISFRDVVHYWLVSPLGDAEIAILFGLLALSGGIAWWLAGQRRLVLVGVGSALLYLVFATWTMHVFSAVRFSLPAWPFVALLVAGNLVMSPRLLRSIATGACAVWLVGAGVWGLPAYQLRREAAPAWAALTWIKKTLDPARTTVVYDGVFSPHVDYLLKGTGFRWEQEQDGTIYGGDRRPDGHVVLLLVHTIPDAEVLFEKDWREPRIPQLAFQRYGSCVVMAAPSGPGPRFSLNWLVEKRGWVVWLQGKIALPEGDLPRLTTVCPLTAPVTVAWAGHAGTVVKAGQHFDVPLFPGTAGEVSVRAPEDGPVLLRPLSFATDPARFEAERLASTELVVPLAVHVPSASGQRWQTDLSVTNLEAKPVRVTATLLRSAGGVVTVGEAVVPARSSLSAADLLAGRAGADPLMGGLVLDAVWTDRDTTRAPALVVLARTFQGKPGEKRGGQRDGAPALVSGAAIRAGGVATFSLSSASAGTRIGLSATSLGRQPVEVVVTARDAGGTQLATTTLRVPALGFAFTWLEGASSAVALQFEVAPQGTAAFVYPGAALVDGATNQVTQLAPERVQNPAGATAVPDWRAVSPHRAGGSGRGATGR